MDDVGAVANAQRLLHVVIGDQHGDSLRGEFTHFLLQVLNGVRINSRERLIKHQDLWTIDQRACNFQTTSLAARAGARFFAGFVFQVKLRQELRGPRLAFHLGHRLQFQHRQQIVLARKALEHGRLLRQIPHAGKGMSVHRQHGHVFAVEGHLPGFRRDHADGHAETGGLARAVASKQTNNFTFGHSECHIIDDSSTVVTLHKPMDF